MAVSKKKSSRITRKDYWALIIGAILLVILAEGIASQIETTHILAGILGALLVSTFLIKKQFPAAKTWYIFSMWETPRFNSFFDFLKNSKWIEWLAEIGAVFGFGAIAIDFFWGKKLKKKWQRALLFVFSVIVLSLFFGATIGSNMTGNPLAKGPIEIYQIVFGIFGLSGFILVALLFQGIDGLLKIFAGKQACPGIAPVIPGVQTPNLPIFVPIEAWVSLLAILIIHEFSHGFLMCRHGLKVLGSGLLLIGFLPIGAFVKPDEKKMKKIDKKKQIHIMSAGPSSNLYSYFIVGLLSMIIFQGAVMPVVAPSFEEIQKEGSLGVNIVAVDQNFIVCGDVFSFPAFGEIEPDTNLLAINDFNVYNVGDALALLSGQNSEKPKKLLLEKNGLLFEKVLEPNELGRLGISVADIPNPDYTPSEETLLSAQIFQIVSPQYATSQELLLPARAFQIIYNIIYWFAILSFLVAIANFLPVEPLDGGRIAKYMIMPYFGFLKMSEEDTERLVGRIFLWILLPLVIINALPIFF